MMQRITSSFIFVLSIHCLLAQAVLQVNVPTNTPDNASIYVAGSFNDWQPGEADFELEHLGGNSYQIELSITPGNYEYKFTRGGWPTVEGNAQGGFIPNRNLNYTGGEQIFDLTIAGWEDISNSPGTAAGNVVIMDDNFYMPQLNRSRRIWLYLPPDYNSTQQEYPVLYMHDAQNLFDQNTSFAGEWEVDETLNALFDEGDPGVIVVGIENGGATRINEYTPWSNPTYGGGEGAAYVDFIVETLKPHIDANYRTLSTAEHTGIAGSSLGGLISLYACIRHQDVFTKAGVLSPSLWFTDDIYDFVDQVGKQNEVRIALLGGEQESDSMVPDLQAMYELLLDKGFTASEIRLLTHADGQHSEWYWRREFGDTYQWLFTALTWLEGSPTITNLQAWPNPVTEEFYLDGLSLEDNYQFSIYNNTGQLIQRVALQENRIDVRALASGHYFLIVQQDNDWGVLHFVK